VRDPRLAPYRAPCLAFALFLGVQAGSAAALFFLKLGPGPARLRAFYLGDPATFAAPRTLEGLLEVAVPHLLAIPLAIFAVAHVVGFARGVGARAHRILLGVSFACVAAGIAAGFGVRYVAPALAWVKIAAFVGLEITLVAWAAFLVLVFAPSAAARPDARAPRARQSRSAEQAEEVAS
jgi:hypothetical protein